MTEDTKNKKIDREPAEDTIESFGDQKMDFQFGAGKSIAYIRPVSKQEVEGALPPGAPEGPYFALHDEEGRPLALFSDADSAWAAARANNLETVSLH